MTHRISAFAQRGDVFVLTAWALSRALVAAGVVAFPHPQFGWVTNWDGQWYEKIATAGYSYVPGSGFSSIAFFPLYPITTRLVMLGGIPFEIAATIVSNA